jgi:hypothetical protein
MADMELLITLNKELKQNDKFKSKLTNQIQMRFGNHKMKEYDEIYKLLEFKDNLYFEQTDNGFVNAFLSAYNNHLTLVLRPDDIHTCLMMICSTFINNNAEALRHLFTKQKDKKELVEIIGPSFDYDVFASQMKDRIKNEVIDKSIIECVDMKYTTTNNIIQCVRNSLLMNTLKEYFNYTCICLCGIPSVKLMGTIDDWKCLMEVYTTIKRIISSVEKSELSAWISCMDVIMNMFIDMRNGIIDKYKKMWERVISIVPYGSGSDTLLGGWIQVFVPYNSLNRVKNIFDNLLCVDPDSIIKSKSEFDHYEYQKYLKKYYGAQYWNELQNSMFETPITLIQSGKQKQVHCLSGLFQNIHINKNNEVHMVHGVFVLQQNSEYALLKKEFIDKGFYVKKDKHGFNTLYIPNKYKNEHHIKKSGRKIFNAQQYQLYD